MASDLVQFNRTLTHNKTQEYLAQVLGEKKASFVNNMTALVSSNSKLQECDPLTIMYAGIKATALDLPLDQNLGFAYVIPYKNNQSGESVAQFQIGSKGFIQLAMRSGQFKSINVRDVREGEIIGEDFISGDLQFKSLGEKRADAKIIGFVAFMRLTNGFEKMLYMTSQELEAHGKKYSKTFSFGNSTWKTEFSAMCEKTVLKRLLSKYAPLSIEMSQAVTYDQAILRDENKPEYLDNEKQIAGSEVATDIFAEALKKTETVVSEAEIIEEKTEVKEDKKETKLKL